MLLGKKNPATATPAAGFSCAGGGNFEIVLTRKPAKNRFDTATLPSLVNKINKKINKKLKNLIKTLDFFRIAEYNNLVSTREHFEKKQTPNRLKNMAPQIYKPVTIRGKEIGFNAAAGRHTFNGRLLSLHADNYLRDIETGTEVVKCSRRALMMLRLQQLFGDASEQIARLAY